MSTIGKLDITKDDRMRLIGRGGFRTLQLALPIRVTPDPNYDPSNQQAPTHQIFTTAPDGRPVQIGVGWVRSLKRGEFEGEDFISMTLDDPSFPVPLSLAAFPRERDASSLEIVWSRPRGEAQRPASNGAEPPPSSEHAGPGLDDDIPF